MTERRAATAAAWRRAHHALVCDRVEPWPHGTLVRASRLPTYYDFNLLRVEGPDPGVGAEALARAADELLGDLAHRRVEVEDEATGARLRAGFERLGWVAERLVWLYREAAPPALPEPDGVELRAASFAATRPLRRAWQGEQVWGDQAEFALVEEQAAERRGARAVIADAGGVPVGFATWKAREQTAEIELAFCLPEHRNRGLGGAILARALADAGAAGAHEALIVADDEGASKRLYERLGFVPVWRQHVFTRLPGQ